MIHFKFLQIFGFNTQNLLIMQKAVSIQPLMDLLLDFQDLSEKLEDHNAGLLQQMAEVMKS